MCPEIQPDYSEVFESVPPGTYAANIVDVEQKDSKAGNTYLKWKLAIADAADARLNGKYVWTNTMIKGAGAFRLKKLCEAALGRKMDGNSPFMTEEMIGKRVRIVTEEGVDQNGSKTGYAEVTDFQQV